MNTGAVGTEAIEAVVKAEHDRVVRIVAVVCGSSVVAEDAVQEAWHRAWTRAARGEALDNVVGWVVVVATNLARDEGRRRGREERALARASAGPGRALARDHATGDLVDLRAAVAGLRLRQRQVIVLHYLLGLKVREIAGVLDVSEGNVKNALHRARAVLAEALGDEEESP
jgi:RNA polymerase sigma-70 factor (ECF subfamily)